MPQALAARASPGRPPRSTPPPVCACTPRSAWASPRKNGKSLLASAFGHYFLVADGEAEPEVYVAAAARGQAGIVLGQAARIGLQSPLLRRHLRIQTHLIECPRNGGLMRALSAAMRRAPARAQPPAQLIDELHAHRDGALYTALTTGTLAREQPFTLWITTAGAVGTFLHEMYRVMEPGSGELEDRGTLRIYRDRANGTLIWWFGAPDDADVRGPRRVASRQPRLLAR